MSAYQNDLLYAFLAKFRTKAALRPETQQGLDSLGLNSGPKSKLCIYEEVDSLLAD